MRILISNSAHRSRGNAEAISPCFFNEFTRPLSMIPIRGNYCARIPQQSPSKQLARQPQLFASLVRPLHKNFCSKSLPNCTIKYTRPTSWFPKPLLLTRQFSSATVNMAPRKIIIDTDPVLEQLLCACE